MHIIHTDQISDCGQNWGEDHISSNGAALHSTYFSKSISTEVTWNTEPFPKHHWACLLEKAMIYHRFTVSQLCHMISRYDVRKSNQPTLTLSLSSTYLTAAGRHQPVNCVVQLTWALQKKNLLFSVRNMLNVTMWGSAVMFLYFNSTKSVQSAQEGVKVKVKVSTALVAAALWPNC